MFLLISPCSRSTSDELREIAAIRDVATLKDIIEKAPYQRVDLKAVRGVLSYREDDRHYICLDTLLSRHYNTWQQEAEHKVSMHFLSNLLDNAPGVYRLEGWHYMLEVEDETGNLHPTLNDLFGQLERFAEGVCLDEHAYEVAELEYAAECVNEVIKNNGLGLGGTAHKWLWNSSFMDAGPDNFLAKLEKIVDEEDNPFFWAYVGKYPSRIIRTLGKRGNVAGYTIFPWPVVQRSLPIGPVKRKRGKSVADLFRGIKVRNGTLIYWPNEPKEVVNVGQ